MNDNARSCWTSAPSTNSASPTHSSAQTNTIECPGGTPRSSYLYLLDLVITRRAALNNVLLTHIFHITACNTDQSMVINKVCLQRKKVHQTKQPRKPNINSNKTADPELSTQFADSIEWTILGNQTQVASVEDK